MSSHRPLALIVCALFVSTLSARQEAPLVRTTSRLVLLDVVVTSNGAPLRNLSKQDFTVLENGAPQKILSFQPPDNTPANQSRTVILLDELNTPFNALSYARDAALRFLHSDAAQNQPLALMAIRMPDLGVMQDYTSNHALVERKLLKWTPLNVQWRGVSDVNWAPEYAQAALHQLMEIARASVGLPYSVNVVWVTSGFSGMLAAKNSYGEFDSTLHHISDLLIQCRVRLYTIDPAGVISRNLTIDTSAKSALQQQSTGSVFTSATGSEALNADILMRRMTAMMGGLSYYGRNDLTAALAQAVRDGSSAYAISYAPANAGFRGEYRKIQVRVNAPGAIARTRPGYYAIDEPAAPDTGLGEARIDAAMQSSVVYSGVKLSCLASFEADHDRLTGKIVIAPSALPPSDPAREQIIRIASFSKSGKRLDFWSWRATWKQPWSNRDVSASFNKLLSAKAKRVRFLVANPSASRIGTCD